MRFPVLNDNGLYHSLRGMARKYFATRQYMNNTVGPRLRIQAMYEWPTILPEPVILALLGERPNFEASLPTDR